MRDGYVIGVDFGSDSVRAVVVDVHNGQTFGEAQCAYPRWFAGKYQDPEKRLFRQHPLDYLEAFKSSICVALDHAGKEVRDHVLSIAIDATGSTPCPVNEEGIPLALLPGFSENVNAMFNLWKDHTAIEEAVEINDHFANYNGIDYTKYQGTYCSEWYWAKILHISRIDEKVKEAAYSWVEHCDWIPAILCGNTNPKTMYRCACAAGHKVLWHSEWNGMPDIKCLEQIDPYLGFIGRTYGRAPRPADAVVGTITEEWANELGIPKDTVIGGSSLDAHAGAVGAGIRKHVMVTNIGTSTVNMLIEDAQTLAGKNLAHACGQAENSIIPGYVGIETSQAAFGDVFAWLSNLLMWPIKNIIAHSETISRGERGRVCRQTEERMLVELGKHVEKLNIEDAMVALDWFNGRRYPYTNELLHSAISGLTLGTDAPAIYQSLMMATVFGQKRILQSLLVEGLHIDEMIAVGGIAQKAPYIMQMMADVLKFPIKVSVSAQACARGAAIYAAVASGVYKTIPEAQEKMQEGFIKTYNPDTSKEAIYEKLYGEYCALGDFVESRQSEQAGAVS